MDIIVLLSENRERSIGLLAEWHWVAVVEAAMPSRPCIINGRRSRPDRTGTGCGVIQVD